MSYGLGLIRSEEDGLDVVSHGGMTLGFTSDMSAPKRRGGLAYQFIRGQYRRGGARESLRAAQWRPEMVETALLGETEAIAVKRARVKLGAEAATWLERIAGEYRSHELGPCVVCRKEEGYWGEFES
ncbi:MAG TPA: hypothetical protein VJQ54_14165 [Candidatus Sulfotelmatobacter sp.]|nr:hypothetical protein [Candidatus Sulfotelmatobacter sp.]